MKRIIRTMWDNFKLGVLGATHPGRAIAAWLTLAFFAGVLILALVYGITILAEGRLVGIALILLATVVVPMYTYFALEPMASLEEMHRRRR